MINIIQQLSFPYKDSEDKQQETPMHIIRELCIGAIDYS